MKIEHIAFNVADPVAIAAWYCQHCGLRIIRHVPQPAQTYFLADGNSTILEIYYNPPDHVLDYRNMNPLLFHLAMASADPVADSKCLVNAGTVLVDEVKMPDGSYLVMLRDRGEWRCNCAIAPRRFSK